MELTAPTPCGPSGFARRRRFAPVLAMSLLAGLAACATTPAPAPVVQASAAPPQPRRRRAPVIVATGPQVTGVASWYTPGPGLHRTCSGQPFTGQALTAASHSIPVGTKVRVALADDTSHSIIVRVNDCMPSNHRILDLSKAAAEELGMLSSGVAQVHVTPVMLVDNR